jgi:DHA1 family tetracycline resistance protein-like MFS transporter
MVSEEAHGILGARQQERRRAQLFVCVVAFADMTGVGITIPVTPYLIASVSEVAIQDAARIGGYFLFIYATIQFLVSPLIGGLSDRFGRKPILLVACFGLSIDYILMALAPTLTLLFIGRIIAGICGSTMASARAVIADMNEPDQRSQGFGLLSAAGGLGFVFGPIVGGLLGQLDSRAPFWAAAAFTLGASFYGLFYFRETLSNERRRPVRIADANPFSAFWRIGMFPQVYRLLSTFFLLQFAAYSLYSIWPYYGIEKFNWSPIVIGVTLTLYGLIFAIFQAGFTSQVTRLYSNRTIIIFSLSIGLFVYVSYAFATSTSIMIIALIISSVTAFNNPCLHAVISSSVPSESQGTLQGVVGSVVSLAAIVGPLVMSNLFSVFSDRHGLYFPGAPFILSALLIVGCLFLFLSADPNPRENA